MKRQVYLPLMHSNRFFCFPESVGWYKDNAEHLVIRSKNVADKYSTHNEANNFSIHIIIDGKGYLKSKDTTFVLQQGDAFLYFPSEDQYYYADKNDPWEVLWVHFTGKYIKDFFIENGFHSSNVWTLKIWANIRQSIISLLEEAEQFAILHPATISALTYDIIAEFIYQAEPLTPNNGYTLYSRIVKMLPTMRELASQPFELKYWSDQLNISTYYFCKMFKKTTGMSPTNFITLCRLQKAKQLLKERNDMTVKQIAIEVGYPSICYFGRLFLENEGMTPVEYRKKI